MAKISKSKNLAAGVTKKIKKAGMVDPKGAYTKVQERTLGNMKHGGIKKAQHGIRGLMKVDSQGKEYLPKMKAPEKYNTPTASPKAPEDMKQKLQPRTAPRTDSLGRPVMKKGGKTFKKSMKNGGVKKAQNGEVETKRGNVSYSTDTTGLAAGKKMFPMTATNSKTGKVTKSSAPRVIVKRQVKESQVKKNSFGGKTSKKK
jgi:hypothetical protein